MDNCFTHQRPLSTHQFCVWGKFTPILKGVTIFSGNIPTAEASRGLCSFEKQSVPVSVRTSSAPPSPIANNPTQDSIADLSRHGR
ncbi:hypothetical protein V6N13_014778 [Hibiscus sabdariffa]